MYLILRQVRLRRLRAKYALIWMCFGLALIPLAVIPGLLDRLASLAGVEYPPALLLVLGLGFFAFLCLQFSIELTRLEERSRVLAEEAALVRERLTRANAPTGRTVEGSVVPGEPEPGSATAI